MCTKVVFHIALHKSSQHMKKKIIICCKPTHLLIYLIRLSVGLFCNFYLTEVDNLGVLRYRRRDETHQAVRLPSCLEGHGRHPLPEHRDGLRLEDQLRHLELLPQEHARVVRL